MNSYDKARAVEVVYTAEYEAATYWWKAHIVLKHIVYLRNFGKI